MESGTPKPFHYFQGLSYAVVPLYAPAMAGRPLDLSQRHSSGALTQNLKLQVFWASRCSARFSSRPAWLHSIRSPPAEPLDRARLPPLPGPDLLRGHG